ncbi:PTS sugar transporter [Ruminococcaceae bacterium OttesenSCG-928-D13]|nr:PTS sugar transporter [Ruminococcaceae bacterium OttesenSCG-928-D13]
MAKRIAIVGSSGGNLYAQGGNNPAVLLGEIFTQAQSAGIEVAFVEFIAASASMDGISQDAQARLYTLQNGAAAPGQAATLAEVNLQAAAADAQLAASIAAGEIDGMITLSSDPKNVNAESLKAAAEKQIPVVGTGGTSMSAAQAMGARVVSASGTTGTTSRTRAVAFIAALAGEFGLKYTPVIGKTGGSVAVGGGPWKRINFRGIMMASLPGFIAMALILAISKIPGLSFLETEVFSTLISVLPAILAAIAAKQISGMDEMGIVAGIVAGILAKDGGIIGGLVAGILAGVLVYYIATFCFKRKVPGTTVSIVAGGLSGLAAGLVGMYLVAPAALWLGDGIRWIIDSAIALSPALAGAVAGLLIWPAIIGGVYHAAILPIVLLEMETVGHSFLGAVDMTGLVMVSAGITLANIVMPRTSGDRAAAIPGFLINMGFGTFVEAAYPYMFSSKLVFGGALLASTVSGALVGILGVRGTAYVPSFSAPPMANEGHAFQFALCMFVALALAFLVTFFANLAARKKQPEEQ